MFNYQGCDENMVLQGVQKFGPAPGAKKMINNQLQSYKQALETGLYKTYTNQNKKSQCFRVCNNSKCFCGHKLSEHKDKYFGKKFDTSCGSCSCKIYKWVPVRPEQCGMWWLPRRKDFNVHTWRPPCKCKHTSQQHQVNYPLRCKICKGNCHQFSSNFACISCDSLWQDHTVLYETIDERKILKKPIGEAFKPLATNPQIQKLVFKDKKEKKSIADEQMQMKHKELNPKQPTKAQLAVRMCDQKIKSPLGFVPVYKPNYPQFLKKK